MGKGTKKGKRGIALLLASFMLGMGVAPYLPQDIFAFHIKIESSGQPGHPDISGDIGDGHGRKGLFCLNKGASAKPNYNYEKVNADVNYTEGTLEEKRLFWAYLMTYGSADEDKSILKLFKYKLPLAGNTRVGKEVAWSKGKSNGGFSLIDQYARDGFASLEQLPSGCKSPQDILNTVMSYNTPETAISIRSLLSGPGVVDAAKLYNLAGLKDYATFKKYCHLNTNPISYDGKMYYLRIEQTENGINYSIVNEQGYIDTGVSKNLPPVIIEVTYDPTVFKVCQVTGQLEYFKCDVSGSQQLYRAKGTYVETNPKFYITTGKGNGSSVITPGENEGGGSLNGGEGIEVKVYQHEETFESNYKVDLTKKDYETGNELENSTWQVLEAFPDQTKLAQDEVAGKLVEVNMSQEPTTWKDWLVFEDDMKTNENGCIIHADKRYYHFNHTYCDGHPKPEPPDGDDEDAEDEYEELMEEWQAKVDECEARAATSGGKHHHWVEGGTERASESEAFEASGAKAARDAAYQNFINLRYSYTFRETDARDGYIIHAKKNGHPDDVPIEIITTPASEAEKDYEWTEASNEDIVVSGYARNFISDVSEKEESESYKVNLLSGRRIPAVATNSGAKEKNLYLTERYDLTSGQKAINALMQFIGLPEKYAVQDDFRLKIEAEYDEVREATSDQAEREAGEDFEEDGSVVNDLCGDEDWKFASRSNVSERKQMKIARRMGTGSNLLQTATSEDAVREYQFNGKKLKVPGTERDVRKIKLFRTAAEEMNIENAIKDSQPLVESGPSDRLLHSFIVYDHRVPGQIHINKRDMELKKGETEAYDSCGDTQGDSTLEGAVYGLFASDDIYHPDTQRNGDGTVKKGTGIVFDANDLVAVATTDKNGDASFLVITERPHSKYNYKTGKIEYSGKEYPKNLYDMDGYRKEYDEEENGRLYRNTLQENGDYWIGRPLLLGNYYIKELTRSEGFELSITGKDMLFTNATEENRDSYGETEDAVSHPNGVAWISDQLTHAVTFPDANETYGKNENLLSVGVRSIHTLKGYDVVFDGIPNTDNVIFYFNHVHTGKVTVRVPVGGEWIDATEEPLYETAADKTIVKRDRDGNAIKNPGAVMDFPVSYVGYGYLAKKTTNTSAVPSDTVKYGQLFTDTDGNFRYVKSEFESMLRQIGVDTPKASDTGSYSETDLPVYDNSVPDGYGMPEYSIQIKNVTTNKSVITALLNYFVSNQVYTYGSLQKLARDRNTVTATIAVGMSPKKTTLYETDEDGNIAAGYLFRLNKKTGRYVMRKYTGDAVSAENIPGSKSKLKLIFRPDFKVNEYTGLPENVLTYRPGTEYLTYQTGETLYDYFEQDRSGNWIGHEPIRRKVYEAKYEDREIDRMETETSKITMVESREAVKDPIGSTYVYYDKERKHYILHAGTKDADLSGQKEASFTIALPDGGITLTGDDIAKIGENNVWGYQVGDRLNNAEYLIRVQGAGSTVHTSSDFDREKSFIKNQRLIYNGNFDLLEDGNTNETPNSVLERTIGQKIKVVKDISVNSDGSYAHNSYDYATAKKAPNFRFKVYLKSNLTRLYRDNDGNIVWQDRKGKEIDQLKQNHFFPARVNKIYTKVLHRETPLFQDSEDAIVSNKRLYAYTNGLINEKQNVGYTAVLETVEEVDNKNGAARTVSKYNYDKFFDAMDAANVDKWDDHNQSFTSWKPIGNKESRNENAIQNAKVSDRVRQFAVRWYLDDEVKKLVRDAATGEGEKEDADGNVKFSEEVYADALHEAIVKAKNYLKPFYDNDLDRIYSIEWDSEKEGGSDKDFTTLSADALQGERDPNATGYYYGISVMLPYGTYVIAEQRPRYEELKDFNNKHYQVDRPHEIGLPAVYVDYDGAQKTPEVLSPYYYYDSAISQEEMERKFKIRFNEEMACVIRGRNTEGDFEVYRYGMNIQAIRNSVTGTGVGDYFALTQSEYKPYKNHYNAEDDRTKGEVPYYLTEGLSGREKVSRYYRYSAVSEDAGIADDVLYQKNGQGYYKDQVKTMSGVLTAYDGKYAQMLVPWTMLPSKNAATEEADMKHKDNGESSYKGFDYTKFRNQFYYAKLRIEKIDSETHENLLHDGALFMIYKAQRDQKRGDVKFYEEDTVITGSEEFLKAMNAEHIQLVANHKTGALFSGTVKAGTPICSEADKIVLSDEQGQDIGQFEAFSTVNDVSMKNEDTNAAPNEYRYQTTGFFKTPQPLGAGVYVLAEVPPRGYVRTKPIAIEIYSDKVTYYKEGNKDARVHAVIYEEALESEQKNQPKRKIDFAQIYVENTPIKLRIEKVKPNGSVSFKIGTRVEGSLIELSDNPKLEYAYANGQYLGYAYERGTLERLKAMKDAGENVEIVYENGCFAGYGYVTRTRDTNDDHNPYVVGAKMTLFDAIELTPSGDTEDHAFEGLQIDRSNTGNIRRMYIKKGYAGKKTELLKETDENGKEILTDYVVGKDKNGNQITKEGYVWKEGTVERPDTDILYYDLDSLSVTWKERIDNREVLFGWDKNHQKVSILQIESDKQNYGKTDREPSIYAFKGGRAVFEFTGGDLSKLKYNSIGKILEGRFAKLEKVNQNRWKMGEGTIIYHLDRDGNRDAMVDPYTGMAYVLEAEPDAEGKHLFDRVLVWPIHIARDEYGNIIARDKITTSRIATLGENADGYNENVIIEPDNQDPENQHIADTDKPGYTHQESGYINGAWKSDRREESHRETSLNVNKKGQNMNEEVLLNDNNGAFLKSLNPVYDEHGLVLYYQRSNETYDKGTELYDRNGDFVRYKDSDNLDAYNRAAYALDETDTLHDGITDQEVQVQDRLYHRQGESYILENTWLTSDKTPNDPFHTQELAGQEDIIKRLPKGTYIMEELATPDGEGYTKALPTGITVEENRKVKTVRTIDDTIKIFIEKTDAPILPKVSVLDMDRGGSKKKVGEHILSAAEYSYAQVSGAKISLYPAKYTTDLSKPDGYKLTKASNQPFVFETTNSNISAMDRLTASWVTGEHPIYVEGIPEGYYLLEEDVVPEGFVKANPIYVHVRSNHEIQSFQMADDHTKVAIRKSKIEDGKKQLLPGAKFALYEAKLDQSGNVVMENGVPQYDRTKQLDRWISSDASEYTSSINLKDYPNTSGKNQVSGFMNEFEKMYSTYGITGTGFAFPVERTATRDHEDSNVWVLQNGGRIVTGNETVTFPTNMSREDRDGFKAAYKDMIGQKKILKWVSVRNARVTKLDLIDARAAGSITEKYPAVVNMKLSIEETGKTVLVNVRYNGKGFSYSYKFDYTELSVTDHANAWLSADGMRRFDYLPANMKLVLVEEKAPEGYAEIVPRVIRVQDIADIQLHDVTNEESALIVAKKSAVTGKEFAGNKLALYKADSNGKLIKTDEYLVEEWTSGADGVYTERDLINGLIPDGFQKGDLRPHYIHHLQSGTYFLVETQAVRYYKAIEPLKINYEGGIELVEAVNRPIRGKLVINKTDTAGRKLTGAVFELNAFDEKGKSLEGFPRQVTDTNGTVTVSDLPVGTVQSDGTIVPYTFKVREVVPPSGYAANTTVYSFRFHDGKEDYTRDPLIEFALNEIHVEDEKTKFHIEKKDLTKLNDAGTDGAFINGAVLALYPIHAITEDGKFSYDPKELFEEWVSSDEEGGHLVEGLIAGQSYALIEKKAPIGYNLMKPVLITVSGDGRSLTELSNNLSLIKVTKVKESLDNPDQDSIAAITVNGRIIRKTEVAVLDETGAEVLRFTGTDGSHVINKTDGLKENSIYTFVEHTLYSDGSDVVTAKLTRRIHFDGDEFLYDGRTASSLQLQVTDEEGNVLFKYVPSEENMEQTIDNCVSPENPIILLKNRNGQDGEPLTETQAVINTIICYNPLPVPADMTVKAELDNTASVLDPYQGTAVGNNVFWSVQKVAPYTQKEVSFASAIEKGVDATSLHVTISVGGKTFQSVKQIPVKKENMLTIYNELTGSGAEQHRAEESRFTIRLWSERGDELAGSYAYKGSRTGVIKSGDILTLAGNEYITIDPANFRNCSYEVRREDSNTVISHGEKGVIGEEGSSAWFNRSVKDSSKRQIFIKGGNYFLKETTKYTDGEERLSNQFSFTLGENAGICAVGGYDKRTKVSVSKTDILTGEELPGNKLQVINQHGRTVDEWLSSGKPHEIQGLIPGESYTLRERMPVDGYAYAEDIMFTVNQDGITDHIVMENKPTHLFVSKKDITNQEELPGAKLEIADKTGKLIESWTSTEKPHEVIGKLIADKEYTLRETVAPDGFVIANEIKFKVSHDGSIDHVDMVDDTTKVRIYKNAYEATASDAERGKAVVGSTLQILNEDKTPVLYRGKGLIFQTAESFHFFEKVLVAGKSYWLREIKPAPGYAYANDVRFTVSTDGKIDPVLMEDKPTDVILSKKAISGEEELPGNKMQLSDRDGNIIEQWTSGNRSHEIKGKLLAGEEYHLIELNPRPGYAYARDVIFTVNKDGTPNHVEMRNDVTKVEILKVSQGNNLPLAGAEFELADSKGMVVDKWTSTKEAHRIYGKLIAGEKYTLRETKAPSGYKKMEDVTISVNSYADLLTVTAENVKIPGGGHHGGGTDYSIRIRKVDEDGKDLPGAAFKAIGEDGKRLSVTKEKGDTVFHVSVPFAQTITVTELDAPEGYEALNGEYQIRVPQTGNAELLNGDDRFYQDTTNSYTFLAVNRKVPVMEQKKGKITAEFQSKIRGMGQAKLLYDGSVIDLSAKTGDDFPLGWLLVMFLGSLSALIAVLCRYKKKGKRPKDDPPKKGSSSSSKRAGLILGMILIGTTALNSKTVFAASYDKVLKEENVQYREKIYVTDTADVEKQNLEFAPSITVNGTIYVLDTVNYEVQTKKKNEEATGNIKVVTSAAFTDAEENHKPDQEMKEGGSRYYLKSYQIIKTALDARKEPVSDIITYSDVPIGSNIPEAAKLSVKDTVTGEKVEVEVPLSEKSFTDPHWIQGFTFPITVTNYDANVFDLNGKEIPLPEDAPLRGYEEDVLKMIGVSAEDYHIDEIKWDGNAYTENDIVYRKLKAVGEMRVADCKAIYAGVVNLPSVEAKAVQAIYSDRPPETDGEESKYSYTMKATAKYVTNQETLKQKSLFDRLVEFIKNPVTVAVLLTLFFILLVIWFIRRKRREQEKIIYISDESDESSDDN